MTNDENSTIRQYSNLDVFGKIKQKIAQGKESDDVVLVSTLAPLSSAPATSSGSTPDYVVGQTAIVNGIAYICSAIGGQEGAWTYTWTVAGGYSKDITFNGSTTHHSVQSTDPSFSLSFYAPTTSGTAPASGGGSAHFLISGGANTPPSWIQVFKNKVSINGTTTSIMSNPSQTEGPFTLFAPTTQGSAGQVLRAKDIGAPEWESVDTSVTQNSSHLITSGAVYSYVQSLPDPMVFKGTVGTSGATVTWANLPQPTPGTGVSSGNEGWVYKVVTAYTNTGSSDYRPTCKVGDSIISTGSEWTVVPSGDETDTLMVQNISTTDNTYPILACPTGNATTSQGAKTGIFSKDILINPAIGRLISKSLEALSVYFTTIHLTDSGLIQFEPTSQTGFGSIYLDEGTTNHHLIFETAHVASSESSFNRVTATMSASNSGGGFEIDLKKGSETITLLNLTTVTFPDRVEPRFSIPDGKISAASFNNYVLADACAKGVDTSFDTTSTSTNLPTTQAVADALKGYIKKASATKSIQAAGVYTVSFNFEPKIIQIFDPDKIQVLARTEVSGSGTSWTVTIRTATALSAAQTWTVNVIGW